MTTFLTVLGIVVVLILVYLVIGLVLYTRVKTLHDCGKHEYINNNEIVLIIFLWLPCGFVHIWRKGIEGI